VAVHEVPITKTTSVRLRLADGVAHQAAAERHIVGVRNSTYSYRALLQWPAIDWSGLNVHQVVKAELVFFSVEDHFGNSALAQNIKVIRVKSAWSEAGTGGEDDWDTVIDLPSNDENYKAYGGPETAAPTTFTIDVTPILQASMPKTVRGPDGQAGAGLADYGVMLTSAGSVAQQQARYFCIASEDFTDALKRPIFRLTYDSVLGPGSVTPHEPMGDIPDVFGENFTGTYNASGVGQRISERHIEVRLAGGAEVWQHIAPTSQQESESGTFQWPLPGSLKSLTDYEWRVRARNNKTATWTPWSEWVAFKVSTTAPALTLEGPSGSHSTLSLVRFAATYEDPEGNSPRLVRIQVRSTTTPVNPVWDTGDHYWDTGDTAVRKVERDERRISRLYEGEGLLAGGYSYRMRATDRLGGVSPWVYGSFTLTKGYEPRPGTTNFLTGYASDQHDWRVRIFDMGANRGPGKMVAEFSDCPTVGATEYYNSPGEFYFTCSITHPQASVVEPFQTHYALEMYNGEGWYPKAYGLITDYDATDDEVVFYGIDYLGVLSMLSDERFNPSDSPDRPVESGGSKYNNWRISDIIKDQLDRAVAAPNSPVGFITVEDITEWDEFVTIFSTFKERLSFISGLIESHRAGTGVRTRLVVERSQTGAFSFRVLDAPGGDRDNIRAEYGGLVQGFRIIPFGQWGTKVHGIGRAVDGTKPYYYRATAPGKFPGPPEQTFEEVYGSFPQVRFWADLADLNDLKRRVKQAARSVAKLGKRMGLGLRVDALDVKDGWDITDSIKVDVKRGIVDTDRFGSGYWTIWGWQWEWAANYPTLTLSLLPRDDTTPPDTDLLPSAPILDYPEWGQGSGPPPVDTQNALYLDVENGDVYEKQDDGTYLLVGNIAGPPGEEGPEGPEGPVGPPGPPGGGDSVAPPVPTVKDAISSTVLNGDGTAITNLVVTIGYPAPPVGLVDLDQFILESTRFALESDASVPDWARATQWVSQTADATGTLDTLVVQPQVLAATGYWLRAYAVDRSGNRQGTPSATVFTTTSEDNEAPPAPAGIVVQAGMSTIGVRWDPIEVADLAYVDVGWRESPDGNWVQVRVAGTMTVITGLVNDQPYDVRVRSVDLSGNTILDPTADPPVTVKATDPDAGWVDAGSATPTPLPGDALVWDEAMIEALFAGNINADWITAGTLRVGGAPGTTTAIEVYDGAGNLIGRWSDAGIEVMDPANPNYKLTIAESSLIIQDLTDPAVPFTTVSISPVGIDAASITFGSARGGHNLILNSSFETGAFSATNVVNSTWDVAADWNAANSRQGSDVNITTGASALTMTTVV